MEDIFFRLLYLGGQHESLFSQCVPFFPQQHFMPNCPHIEIWFDAQPHAFGLGRGRFPAVGGGIGGALPFALTGYVGCAASPPIPVLFEPPTPVASCR